MKISISFASISNIFLIYRWALSMAHPYTLSAIPIQFKFKPKYQTSELQTQTPFEFFNHVGTWHVFRSNDRYLIIVYCGELVMDGRNK